ncbi:MAG: right-handed parallel beta-helix repeat-containing protein [Candidatus Bathyarchaeia archaeon]
MIRKTFILLVTTLMIISMIIMVSAVLYKYFMHEEKTVIACAVFYVSPEGRDEWSGKLPEPNEDKTDGPFATITRARDAIRELKRKGELKCPIVVKVRGGLYWLNEPITFTPEDSGTEENPIIYQAYEGEIPIISGGRLIVGWRTEKLSDNLVAWVADIPEAKEGKWYFKQLFVNGERRFRPRLPEDGFFWIEDVPGKKPEELSLFDGSSTFKCASGDIKQWKNINDVEVVVLHYWIEERIPIKSFDEKNNIVELSMKTVFALRDDFKPRFARYYVENVFEALKKPGEWYLDRVTGKLYYIPLPGEEIGSCQIIAPRLNCLIRVIGSPERGQYVEHIVFRGLVFQYTEWQYSLSPQAAQSVPGAIYLEGARFITIEKCKIEHVGGYGIEVRRGCSRIFIINNVFSDLGAGGIKIGEPNVPTQIYDETGYNVVSDNRISKGGRIFHSAVAIWIGQSGYNEIIHNTIHDFYYTGISVGWTWGYGSTNARCNIIEFNHIFDIGHGLLSDMGGIYTLGVQPGTTIRFNLIHNVEAYNYGGWGIYLDEGSSHILVENNIVYNTMSGGFHQHYGRENIIRNNIFALSKEGQVVFSRGEPQHIAFIFERNIVLTNGSPIFVGGYAEEFWRRDFRSNLNLFYDISGGPIIFLESSKGRKYSLEEWRDFGYDTYSIIADPRFKEIRKYDFTLLEDSPAFKIGFKPINLEGVGARLKDSSEDPS